MINRIIELIKKYKEQLSYLFFGGLTTLISWGVSSIFYYYIFEESQTTLANVISEVIAITFAYVTNKLFVFNSKTPEFKSFIKELLSFYALRIISTLFNIAGMKITVDLLHFEFYVCKILLNVIVIILNYFFSKLFVFNKSKKKNEHIVIKDKTTVYFSKLENISDLIEEKGAKIVIFASKKVENYSSVIENCLNNSGFDVYTYLTSDGEENKNLNKAVTFTEFLQINQIGRRDLIINIGGGTVCDLGAFVASLYMRGISYINIPTTLLCAVDACIGGKTAIDSLDVKNLWGTFHHPSKVLIDVDLLNSLPIEILNEGMSEIIKYAIIDNKFYNFIDSMANVEEIFSNLKEVIYRSLEIKAHYVEKDEFDYSIRRRLNAGHTIAHALESTSNYSVSHAQAVAYGLNKENEIAFALNLISEKRYTQIANLCDKFLLNVMPSNVEFEIEHTLNDKKNMNGKIVLSLPTEQSVDVYFISVIKLSEILKEVGF